MKQLLTLLAVCISFTSIAQSPLFSILFPHHPISCSNYIEIGYAGDIYKSFPPLITYCDKQYKFENHPGEFGLLITKSSYEVLSNLIKEGVAHKDIPDQSNKYAEFYFFVYENNSPVSFYLIRTKGKQKLLLQSMIRELTAKKCDNVLIDHLNYFLECFDRIPDYYKE